MSSYVEHVIFYINILEPQQARVNPPNPTKKYTLFTLSTQYLFPEINLLHNDIMTTHSD